jgi:hypothetical protein
VSLVPIYYFAADIAKQRVETGGMSLGAGQPSIVLLLTGKPSAGSLPIRDLSYAPLLRDGGPAMLPGMVAQTRDALGEGEHLILLAETVFHQRGAAQATAAVLVWVGSRCAQLLGMNPILPGEPRPTIAIQRPIDIPAAPAEAIHLLFPQQSQSLLH